jgi:signal transduction histidine kinase
MPSASSPLNATAPPVSEPRRRAFDQLQLAQGVRAQLMHDAEVGPWRYDPDADVYYFSSELSLGHDGAGAPVPSATLALIQHEDDRAKDAEIRARITREGGAAESEMRYRNAEGGWTHLRVLYRAGARLPSGLYEMFGLSVSITALAKARDAAGVMAQRLDLALKASRAGVFEYDYRTDTYWASSEFAHLIGAEGWQRMQSDVFSVLDTEDAASLKALLRRAEDGPAEPVDLRLRRPDGERWMKVYYEVERGPDGAPHRGVGLMIDIHEAKRQEIAVGEARELAEAATRAKSDFLASVSHEIRTPMNGIVGVLNLLRREQLSDEGRQLLEEALGCAGMLSELVNDVLDFSKIEAGKLELSPEATDPAAVTRGVVSLVKPQAEAKGLTLATSFGEGVGWAMIDPVRLRQCLFNLIGNAVKFTDAGGVEVRVSALGGPDAPKLRFEIEDTGVGVPEDARARLFGRFEQAEAGAARRFAGTGLGLAISRQLARLMGGELDYWSCEGEGSTFWFEIAAPPAAAPDASASEAHEAPLAGLRVLVVDDNRVNRLVGVKSLEALGAEAEAVDSGLAAIAAIEAHAFDVVLMDVNMPGMDGLEATRRIRALGPKGASLPIVALTADVMRHQREACFAAGMNGVVPKPFTPTQLLAELARLSGDDSDPVPLPLAGTRL